MKGMIESTYVGPIRDVDHRTFDNYAIGEGRLLLISGLGGSGKTTFMQQCLSRHNILSVNIKFAADRSTGIFNEFVEYLVELIVENEKGSGIKWATILNNAPADFSCLLSFAPKLSEFIVNLESIGSPIQEFAVVHLAIKELCRVISDNVDRLLFFVFDDVQWADHEDMEFIFELIRDERIDAKMIFLSRSERCYQESLDEINMRLRRHSISNVIMELSLLTMQESISFILNFQKIISSNIERTQVVRIAEHGGGNLRSIVRKLNNQVGVQMLSDIERRMLFRAALLGFTFNRLVLEVGFPGYEFATLESLQKGLFLEKIDEDTFSFVHDLDHAECLMLFPHEVEKKVLKEMSLSLYLGQAKRKEVTDFLIASILLKITSESIEIPRAFLFNLYLNGAVEAALESKAELRYKIGCRLFQLIKTDKKLSSRAVDACREIAISSYFANDLVQMEEVLSFVLAQNIPLEDKMNMYQILVDGYMSKNEMLKAVAIAREGLALLGMDMPHDDALTLPLLVATELSRTVISISKLNRHFSVCNDPVAKSKAALLSKCLIACYSTNFFLAGYLVFVIINDAVKYGITEETSYTLTLYATAISSGIFRDYRYTPFLLRLAKKIELVLSTGYYRQRSVFSVEAFYGAHSKSISESTEKLDGVFHSQLSVGSLDFAAYAAHLSVFHGFDSVIPLREIRERVGLYRNKLGRFRQENADLWIRSVCQLVIDLETKSPKILMAGDVFDIQRDITPSGIANDRSAVFIANHFAGVGCNLYERYESALKHFDLAKEYVDGIRGTYGEALFAFHFGVAKSRIGLKNSCSVSLSKELNYLQKLEKQGSVSVVSKVRCLKGYCYLLKGAKSKALKLFNSAEKTAVRHGHTVDQIIALQAKIFVLKLLGDDSIPTKSRLKGVLEVWGARGLLRELSEEENTLTVSAIESLGEMGYLDRQKIMIFLGNILSASQWEYEPERTISVDVEFRGATDVHVDASNFGKDCGVLRFILDHPGRSTQLKSSIADLRNCFKLISYHNETQIRLLSLREDEKKYRQSYELSSSGLFNADISGRLNRANVEALNIFGVKNGPVGRMDILDLFENVTRLDCSSFVEKAICQPDVLFKEVGFVEGNNRHISVSIVNHQNKYINGSIVDISDQINRAIYAERLINQAKKYSGISHEIKNPMQSVMGLNLKAIDQTNSEEQREVLYRQGKLIERMTHAMDEVMHLGRAYEKESMQLKKFSPVSLCFDLLSVFKYEAIDGGISLGVSGPLSSIMNVYSDKGYVTHIVHNLLSNAIRHSKGTSVDISCIEHQTKYEVHVKDNGLGISEALQDHIFGYYFTTSNKGSGVGLATCREFAQAMGANLECVKNDVGAHFKFTFPVSDARHGNLLGVYDVIILNECINDSESFGWVYKAITENNLINTSRKVVLIATDDELTDVETILHKYENQHRLVGAVVLSDNESFRSAASKWILFLPRYALDKAGSLIDGLSFTFEDAPQITTTSILFIDDSMTPVDLPGFGQGLFADIACNEEEYFNAISKKRYDLIFVDYTLYRSDGLSVIKTILAMQGGSIPIVGMSSNPIRKDEMLLSGAVDFVDKPLQKECVYDVLESTKILREKKNIANLALDFYQKEDFKTALRVMYDNNEYEALANRIHDLIYFSKIFIPGSSAKFICFEDEVRSGDANLDMVLEVCNWYGALLLAAKRIAKIGGEGVG
ncbi:hypothetical protein A9Q99_27360 [Gammaproteobacteria bacterium 45_16_T64]|nr:hypothetical protein A9Q99_27360 [Gammaproteobacteria bacterium 45_16_T64]